MFWPIQRSKQTRERNSRSRRQMGKRLFLESLESRQLLAGDVTVTLVGTTLTLEGDVSGNIVEISPGTNIGEYKIQGLDNTTINGPCSIVDPVDRIVVALKGGSDSFTLKSTDASNKIYVGGNVEITNSDGLNVNKLVNAEIAGELIVQKDAGTSESQLYIEGTTVVGKVTVNNQGVGGFDGDSKTMITKDSHLQADLDVDNDEGEDTLVVYQSNIDGNVTIDNRDGDTRTVFGLNEDPIIWGSLTINNGDGNDEIILHDTNVWLDVAINNGTGHTLVSLETTNVGLGVDVGVAGNLTIQNGTGIDQFRMVDSMVKDNVGLNNGTGTFGSLTEIVDSRIGNDLSLAADNGLDRVTITDSVIVDDAQLTLLGGSSEVALSGTNFQERLIISAAAGSDHVRMERTTVDGDTTISLGDGVDLLEILAASRLLGQSSLTGGGNIDQFWRQLGPATEAVEIAFLAAEDFELDYFKLA